MESGDFLSTSRILSITDWYSGELLSQTSNRNNRCPFPKMRSIQCNIGELIATVKARWKYLHLLVQCYESQFPVPHKSAKNSRELISFRMTKIRRTKRYSLHAPINITADNGRIATVNSEIHLKSFDRYSAGACVLNLRLASIFEIAMLNKINFFSQ